MPMTRRLALFGTLAILVISFGCGEEETGGDKTPPTVVASFPQSGATGVSRSGPYWVTFSEPMDKESVEDAISIQPQFWFTSFWRGETVFIAPYTLLSPQTTYTLRIGTAAKDLAGNALGGVFEVTFTTTSEADLTRPTVVSTQPPDGATGVPCDAPIIIIFSEPMNINTTRDAISIEPSVRLDIKVEAYTVTITHGALPPDSLITVTVDTTATDLAGNHLASRHSFSFRTVKDLVRPRLASASPANGATGVSTNLSQIVLTFSEPMDPHSFDNFPIEDLDARLLHLLSEEPEFEPPYTTAILKIGKPLLPGCTYWVIFRNVTDFAGNLIDPSPTHYRFTTKGTLTYFPLTYPNWWEYTSIGYGDKEICKIENYNKSSGRFNYAFYDQDGKRTSLQELRLSDNTIYIHGFKNYDEDGDIEMSVTFDNPIAYIPTNPHLRLGESRDFECLGTAVIHGESYRLRISGNMQIDPETTLVAVERLNGSFRQCAVLNLNARLVIYAAVDSLEHRVQNIAYLAPGVGIVKRIEFDFEEGRADTVLISNWGAQ